MRSIQKQFVVDVARVKLEEAKTSGCDPLMLDSCNVTDDEHGFWLLGTTREGHHLFAVADWIPGLEGSSWLAPQVFSAPTHKLLVLSLPLALRDRAGLVVVVDSAKG